ncbi:hypothetical protein VOLCADRAFT_95778 [Volvox carteri f. nagariensis]|uniref:Uncharacterized protein n=1 Tax=Volvox carteri f. nagariensis TaxID=3068 RepID=D8U8D0_VOLCA|nr:uncharacterized protein VOLCADRAFT_95778 [Volvox carteri f. nagariensis]EFJ44071.1 hypothetical protein VOLCADRAFT_95778 [Volvox carteri f. nagariensis]|eukprot:XP_002954872.1 hypothetical protein VOLCADRAFT_95778 [Volvox carteri f. nagariensis]
MYGVLTFLKVFHMVPRLPNESHYLFKHCLLSMADAFFCQVPVHKIYLAQVIDAALRSIVWRLYDVLPGAPMPVVTLVSLTWQAWIVVFSSMLQARHVTTYRRLIQAPQRLQQSQEISAAAAAGGSDAKAEMTPSRASSGSLVSPAAPTSSGVSAALASVSERQPHAQQQWQQPMPQGQQQHQQHPSASAPLLCSPPVEHLPPGHLSGSTTVTSTTTATNTVSDLSPDTSPPFGVVFLPQNCDQMLVSRCSSTSTRTRSGLSSATSIPYRVIAASSGIAIDPDAVADAETTPVAWPEEEEEELQLLSRTEGIGPVYGGGRGSNGIGGGGMRYGDYTTAGRGAGRGRAVVPAGEKVGREEVMEEEEDDGDDYRAPIPMLSTVEILEGSSGQLAPLEDEARLGTGCTGESVREATVAIAPASSTTTANATVTYRRPRRVASVGGLVASTPAAAAAPFANLSLEARVTDVKSPGTMAAAAAASSSPQLQPQPPRPAAEALSSVELTALIPRGLGQRAGSCRSRQSEAALRRLMRGPSSYVLLSKQRERDQNVRPTSTSVQLVVTNAEPHQLGPQWRNKLATAMAESVPGWHLANVSVRQGSLIVHLDLVYQPVAAGGRAGGRPSMGDLPPASANDFISVQHGGRMLKFSYNAPPWSTTGEIESGAESVRPVVSESGRSRSGSGVRLRRRHGGGQAATAPAAAAAAAVAAVATILFNASRRNAAALYDAVLLALSPPPLLATRDYVAFLHARVGLLHIAYANLMAVTMLIFYAWHRGKGLRLTNILCFMAPELLTVAGGAVASGSSGGGWAAVRTPLVHVGVALRGILTLGTSVGVMPLVSQVHAGMAPRGRQVQLSTGADDCAGMRWIMKMMLISTLQVLCMQTPVRLAFAVRLLPLAGAITSHLLLCHPESPYLDGLALHLGWEAALFLLAASMQASSCFSFMNSSSVSTKAAAAAAAASTSIGCDGGSSSKSRSSGGGRVAAAAAAAAAVMASGSNASTITGFLTAAAGDKSSAMPISVVEELQVVLRHISPASMASGVHAASPATVITRTLAAPAAAHVQRPPGAPLQFDAELTMVAATQDAPGVVHVELWRRHRRLAARPVLLTAVAPPPPPLQVKEAALTAASTAAAGQGADLPHWLQDVVSYLGTVNSEGHASAADQFVEELGGWLAQLAAFQRGLTATPDGSGTLCAGAAAAQRITRVLRVHNARPAPRPAPATAGDGSRGGGAQPPQPRQGPGGSGGTAAAPEEKEEVGASGLSPPVPRPPPDPASATIRQLLLCQGQGLLAVAVEAGCVALAEHLLGLLLGPLGAETAAALESAVTPVTGLPLLHAAVKSGCTEMVDVVVGWQTRAGVDEIWAREAVVRAVSLEPRVQGCGLRRGASTTTHLTSPSFVAAVGGFAVAGSTAAATVMATAAPPPPLQPQPPLSEPDATVTAAAMVAEPQPSPSPPERQHQLLFMTACDSDVDDAAAVAESGREPDKLTSVPLGLQHLPKGRLSDGSDVSLTGSFLLETIRQSPPHSVAAPSVPSLTRPPQQQPDAAGRQQPAPAVPIPRSSNRTASHPADEGAMAVVAARSTFTAVAAATIAAAYTSTGVSVAAAVAAADLAPPPGQKPAVGLSAPFKVVCLRPETTDASSAVQVLPRNARDAKEPVATAAADGFMHQPLYDARVTNALHYGGGSEISAAFPTQNRMALFAAGPAAAPFVSTAVADLEKGRLMCSSAAAVGSGGGNGGGGGGTEAERASFESQWTLVDGGVLLLTPLHVALALDDEGRVATHILAKYPEAHDIYSANQAQWLATGADNVGGNSALDSSAMASPFDARPLLPVGIPFRRGSSAANATATSAVIAMQSHAAHARHRISGFGGCGGSSAAVTAAPGGERTTPRGWLPMSGRARNGHEEGANGYGGGGPDGGGLPSPPLGFLGAIQDVEREDEAVQSLSLAKVAFLEGLRKTVPGGNLLEKGSDDGNGNGGDVTLKP